MWLNAHKETDRVSAVVDRLSRLGLKVDEHPDRNEDPPRARCMRGTVATYDDHRMAMSFLLLGLAVPGIVIAILAARRRLIPIISGTWNRLCESANDLLVGRTILSVFIELPPGRTGLSVLRRVQPKYQKSWASRIPNPCYHASPRRCWAAE